MSKGIVILYLPLSGSVVCYNETDPVSSEELEELDMLMLKMRKVFAISMGIPQEENDGNQVREQAGM